ncbi:MAG: aminotransferase class I/II-fold pyridoxal phosphate-dependent enzyme [Candidatus Thioglobus sp.]
MITDIQKNLKQLISEELSLRQQNSVHPFEHTVGWPQYDENELYAALDSLLDLSLSQGPRVRAFESAYSDYLDLPEGSGALAVNSGSSANLVTFAALIDMGRLEVGDEVLVAAATFATVSSVLYQVGLVPVYIDSEMDTWNMDPDELKIAVSPKTKAIMVVHNLGIPAKMDEIMAVAEVNGLIVIEDCCEAHGSYYKGRQVGSIGDMATLSFFVAHNITTGEGGMIFYKDKLLGNKLRSVREFGRSINAEQRYQRYPEIGEYDTRYIFETLGYNVRMTDFAAAMGLVQLGKLENLNKIRRQNAKRLTGIIGKYSEYLSTQEIQPDVVPGYYGFPIYLKPNNDITRNEFCAHLEKFKIETRPNMGGCLPDQPGFIGRNHRVHGDLTNARLIRDNALFVGVHSGLTSKNFDNFVAALDEVFSKFHSI